VAAVLLTLAGTAGAADLLDVYREARKSDQLYAAARATWAASQERLPQGRAGLLPFASVSGSVQYGDRTTRYRDPSLTRSNADFISTAISLSVTQPVFRQQNLIVYEQALTQVEQADAQFALAAQDLLLRVAQAYFDVLLAQDTVAFAEAQKSAIAQQLAQAKKAFQVGTATITDTHEAQARYDLTTAQELAARNELELRRRALALITGRGAPALLPLGNAFELKIPDSATIEQWVDLAVRGNLQVRILVSAVTLATQEIDRNRAAHYPTIDAFATVSEAGSGSTQTVGTTVLTSGTDTRNYAVGLQLAVPLYQGGVVNSRVREAIANEDRVRSELENARRTAEFSARQGYLGITSGAAQVRALEAAATSTQSQLSSTKRGQEVGVRTQVDVLNAQQLLFSSRRDLAQARYSYVLSLLRLEAAVGELTEEDLAAVNQWLQR
jgi:outer membrane protein